MTTDEKTLARLFFRNKILESNGQVFEDLFTKVMSYSRKDFVPVKPQGSFGDRKNDGFEKPSGRYFQVFAPEDATTKESEAIKKIETDFAGLHKYWQSQGVGIVEFYFVLNDKYKGAYPTTDQALEDLKTKYPTLTISDKFLAKHLENEMFTLDDDQIFLIIGTLPNPENISTIDYRVLDEVIRFIDLKPMLPFEAGKLVAPEFGEKIKFNGLICTKPLLETAWYQCSVVDDFYKNESDFAKEELRDKLNSYYIEARNKFSGLEETELGDLVFIEILNSIIPTKIEKAEYKRYREAAVVLMATFFESCDIFEEPTSGAS